MDTAQSGSSKVPDDILPKVTLGVRVLLSWAGARDLRANKVSLRLKNTVGLRLKFVPKSWLELVCGKCQCERTDKLEKMMANVTTR